MNNSNVQNKIDINESYGKFIGVTLNGTMEPLIQSGINSVTLYEIPYDVILKRLDLVLYKTSDESAILKRVFFHTKKYLWVCGDSETKLTKINRSDVFAICTGIIDNVNNKTTDVMDKTYRKYAKKIAMSRVIRQIKKVISKDKKNETNA